MVVLEHTSELYSRSSRALITARETSLGSDQEGASEWIYAQEHDEFDETYQSSLGIVGRSLV